MPIVRPCPCCSQKHATSDEARACWAEIVDAKAAATYGRAQATSVPAEEKQRLRQDMIEDPTPSEAALWRWLCTRPRGVRFTRQRPIEGYIVDFAAKSARL